MPTQRMKGGGQFILFFPNWKINPLKLSPCPGYGALAWPAGVFCNRWNSRQTRQPCQRTSGKNVVDKIAPLRSAIFPIQTALFLRQAIIVSISSTAQKNPGNPPLGNRYAYLLYKAPWGAGRSMPAPSRATFKISVLVLHEV